MLLAKLYVWWVTGHCSGLCAHEGMLQPYLCSCTSQHSLELLPRLELESWIARKLQCVLCLPVNVSASPSRWLVDRQVRLCFSTCTVLGTTDLSAFQQLVMEHRGLGVSRPCGTGLTTPLTCIPHSWLTRSGKDR